MSDQEQKVVVPYKTDWAFVGLCLTPPLALAVFVLTAMFW